MQTLIVRWLVKDMDAAIRAVEELHNTCVVLTFDDNYGQDGVELDEGKVLIEPDEDRDGNRFVVVTWAGDIPDYCEDVAPTCLDGIPTCDEGGVALNGEAFEWEVLG